MKKLLKQLVFILSLLPVVAFAQVVNPTGITVLNNGTPLAGVANSFDLIGITATGTGSTKTLTVTGGGGLPVVYHDGTLIGDGTSGTPLGLAPLLTDGTSIVGDGIITPLTALATPENKIISGGIAWSGTGYVYDVNAVTYYFNGPHVTTPTTVTMATADPTYNRFDAVVVDENGTVSVITGTATDNPAFPTIPSTQLVVGYVLVEAGTTQPTVLQDNIYLNNAEWTTSTYTTGSGATGTVNFNYGTSCKEGTKCIDLVTNQRLGARFTRATAIDAQQFAYVQVWVKFPTALATTKTPYVRFDNSLGNPVGNNVSLLNYGVSRTVVGTWQQAVIPVSAFGSITTVKGLRAIMLGGTLASQAQWQLDFILMSGGILPQSAIGPVYLSPSGNLYSTGAAFGATTAQNSNMFGNLAGFNATNADYSIFNGYKSGYNALNATNSQFLGYSSGYAASSAYSSTFIGTESGLNALNANQSVFIGRESGRGGTSANNSFFLGYQAGSGAINASTSAFLGSEAGFGATNASGSIFLGYNAGNGATNAANSIFIGTNAGLADTTTSNATLIGYQASSGGFSDVIGLGALATNTASNQLMIGSGSIPITDIHWQGILTSTGMHNSPLPQTGPSEQQVRSGTYTPTLTNVANVTTSSASPTKWFRIGNIVHVEGQVSITPTSNNTQTIIDISLPVPSTLGNSYVVSGVTHSVNSNVAGHGGSIIGQTSNNTARLQYYETSGAADIMTYEFSYEVL